MRIRYFEDTDTALIEFTSSCVAETRELSEDICVDFDVEGGVVGSTVKHAITRGDISEMIFQPVPTKSVNKSLEPTR